MTAAAAQTVSKSARRHLERDAGRRGPGRPPNPPEPSSSSSPASSPAPAPPVPAPLPWAAFGKTIKATADPLYVAMGATPPPLEAWEAFADAWGAVVDYYLPFVETTPIPKAIIATTMVAMPLLIAWQRKNAERAELEARRIAAAKPAEPSASAPALERKAA